MDPFEALLHRHAGVAYEHQLALDELLDGSALAYERETGRLTVDDDGVMAARPLGWIDGGAWRWAWADAEAGAGAWEDGLLAAAEGVRRQGVEVGADELITAEQELSAGRLEALFLVCVGARDGFGVARVEEGGKTLAVLVSKPEEGLEPAPPRRMVYVFEQLTKELGLGDERRALGAYLRARKVHHQAEGDQLVGLTIDGQTLVASFSGKRLQGLELRPDPPGDGVRVDGLEWSGEAGAVKVKLGALGVGALGRLLRHRALLSGEAFQLRGSRKRTLGVSPSRESGVELEGEDALALRLTRESMRDVLTTLRPRCGELTWPSVPGLTLEVVASEIEDEDGHRVRTLGWEPTPEPPWALDPEEVAAERGASARRAARRNRLARRGALLVLLLSPLLFLACGQWFLRHVPYAIPPHLQAPAPGVGLALGQGVRVRYLGVTGYEVTDGETVILTDPVLTRPTFGELLTGPIDPDPSLHDAIRQADFILVNHAHHDHSLDAPALALRTGATVLGSTSVINLCRARGVPEAQLREAVPGERVRLGTFVVDVRAAVHSHIGPIADPMSGTIPPDAGPLWFFDYTNDGSRSYRFEAGGTSVWFHPSSAFSPGELGLSADSLIYGIAGDPIDAAKARQVLDEVQPARVILTHYDNFLQPRSAGLNTLPVVDPDASAAAFRAGDPDLPVWVLDYDQVVELSAP
jgi:L-ascorbate metabolism protein UlaG (beta-lactamase superfamily)